MTEAPKVTGIKALKAFFEADGGRRLSMQELKDLGHDDRAELIRLAAVELDVVIEVKHR